MRRHPIMRLPSARQSRSPALPLRRRRDPAAVAPASTVGLAVSSGPSGLFGPSRLAKIARLAGIAAVAGTAGMAVLAAGGCGHRPGAAAGPQGAATGHAAEAPRRGGTVVTGWTAEPNGVNELI